MTSTRHWPHSLPQSPASGRHVWLRVLVTSDMHGQLLPVVPDESGAARATGLTRIATLVRTARRDAANTLLVDNGDFLQGSPLSDLAAQADGGWTGPNPVIRAMNALAYDAVALGNHEFNFGLSRLQDLLAEARFPMICANAVTRMGPSGPAEDETLLPPYVILPMRARDSAGGWCEIRVGLIGLLPPQITVWDHDNLSGRLGTRDIVETARAHVPRMRAEGAQIVLALAHTGIGTGLAEVEAENAALALAAVPGLDAVIAGHSHEVFPRHTGTEAQQGVDHVAGTFRGKPAVMAGSRGSHLGVLDLCLDVRDGAPARILAHKSEARATTPPDRAAPPPDPDMMRLLEPAHAAMARLTSAPLAQVPFALHSYTAFARCDRLQRLVLGVQRRALRRALADTPHADLPVLAATAPFQTGGHAGPGHFVDLGPRLLCLRDLAEFYPFPNTLIGLRVTGRDLALWLERAASGFHRVTPGETDQPLWHAAFPGHTFDSIAGLDYRIDPSQPARFGADGRVIDPQASRIADLTFAGAPVAPDMVFALAVNSFRAFGGGNYPPADESRILFRGQSLMRDIIARDIVSEGVDEAALPAAPWAFRPLPGTRATLRTGPGLRRYPADIRALGAADLGLDAAGFLELRIPLDFVVSDPLRIRVAEPN